MDEIINNVTEATQEIELPTESNGNLIIGACTFIAGVITTVGGYFAAKGIKSKIKAKKEDLSNKAVDAEANTVNEKQDN